jgi:hypothetical protein
MVLARLSDDADPQVDGFGIRGPRLQRWRWRQVTMMTLKIPLKIPFRAVAFIFPY